MSELVDNYFAIEQLLVGRVSEIPELSITMGMADTANIMDLSNYDSAAYIVYRGERAQTGDRAVAGVDQIVYQQWTVFVVVRSAARGSKASDMISSAGELLRSVNNKLQGWRAGNDYSRLVRITPPSPTYLKGAALFPMSYEVRIVEKSENY